MTQSSQLKKMTFKAVKGVNFRGKFLRLRKPLTAINVKNRIETRAKGVSQE